MCTAVKQENQTHSRGLKVCFSFSSLCSKGFFYITIEENSNFSEWVSLHFSVVGCGLVRVVFSIGPFIARHRIAKVAWLSIEARSSTEPNQTNTKRNSSSTNSEQRTTCLSSRRTGDHPARLGSKRRKAGKNWKCWNVSNGKGKKDWM